VGLDEKYCMSAVGQIRWRCCTRASSSRPEEGGLDLGVDQDERAGEDERFVGDAEFGVTALEDVD
jgi:hypothetical protein